MLMLVAVVTRQGCVLLVRVKRRLEERGVRLLTYPEVAEHVLGTFAMHLVRLLLVFTQFLFCVGYFIFLSQTLRDLLGHDKLSKPEAVAVFVLPIVLTSLVREVHRLRPFSVFANVALLTGFVVVLTLEFRKDNRDGVQHERGFKFGGLPLLFGILTSAFEGIGCLLPIEASLRIQRNRFENLLDVTLSIVTFILGSFAVVSVLTYGAETKDIVISNLPNSPVISVLKVCLIIGILFTYPLQLVPVTRISERFLLRVPSDSPRPSEVVPAADAPRDEETLINRDGTAGGGSDEFGDVQNDFDGGDDDDDTKGALVPRFGNTGLQTTLENALRVFLVLATAGLSLLIPNFHTVVGLVGSLGASGLAYVIPAFLASAIDGDPKPSSGAHAFHLFMAVFGIVGGVAGTYVTLKNA